VFDWLFEGQRAVYITLGAVTIVLFVLWVKVPRRSYLIGTGIGLLLIGLYWVLDRMVVTPREEIEETIRLMADSVARRDIDPIFAHFCKDFRTPHGHTRDEFRQRVEPQVHAGQITVVKVWGFEFPGPVDRTKPVKVTFQFKVEGPIVGSKEGMFFRCDAVCGHEAPNGWCIRSVKIFDPIHIDEEVNVPY
jgi:hypothetical protein